MTITLTPHQIAHLRALVQAGTYSSVEDAARHLIDERLAELEIEQDDLAWAKPLVDEALIDVERGDLVTLEQHRKDMTEFMSSLGRR
jgi:antitoxin ParD1/3/4